MKKPCLFLIVLLSSLFSFSQNVAINDDGTDPNNSAMLDVKSGSKGILIPRLTSLQRNGILLPGTGLLVYQIDGVQGFYYNSGTPEMPLWLHITNQNTGWQVGGNAGTNPATNFLGTTDNQPLVFKTNNLVMGRWGGTNLSLGLMAMNNGLPTGNGNIAIGAQAQFKNANGQENVSVGAGTLFETISGFGNTAVGSAALFKNTASGNTALGKDALSNNTTGGSNVSIGYVSGIGNTTGSRNTIVGTAANFGAVNLNNATAIGANSRVDCDDCLVLGSLANINNATSTSRVGIGITNPNNSAILDLTSTEKGVLIPRMTQSQRTAIVSPANGLLIYQIDNTPGFYFYNGLAWIGLTDNTSTLLKSWSLSGNEGINENNQFLGTRDNKPLVFKINNIKAGKLDLINTSFGVNTLSGNNPGESNVAIGNFALQNNSANYNAAFGNRSMWYNASGQNNSAFGYGSLIQNTTGSSNTAIGNSALNINTTGNYNTAIGSFSDVGTEGLNNATAIGANAKVDCDDCLVLGSVAGVNNGISTTRVGIGITNPNPSAVLELSSNNKGLLIPRMTMMEALGISNPANGLLVYITDEPSGIYYNQGTQSLPDWKILLTNNSGWKLGGNDVVSHSSIGTKNNVPLTLLVNNNQGGFIDASNTSTSFGYQANHTLNVDNVAIGYQAITDNTEGGSNVAIGTRAQRNNLSGYGNVSLGNNTLQSLRFGGGNTAIGESADVNDEYRMNATAIGAYSKVDCDNCLVLGNVNPNDENWTVRTGIGTTNPHASAALEIASTKRGLLIPRMTESQRNAIASPVNGLIIYQTDNEPGIYAYNGTTWNAVTPNTNAILANTWGTNGNSGTDPALNFIGTIDNKPLTFKTNNELSGYIDPLLKNVLFGRLQDANIQGITNSVGIGNNALSTNWEGAEGLIGIGNNALKESYGGSYLNVAIGESAGEFNVATYDNIAIGSFTMKENYLGSWNVAIGSQAMKIIRGNENVAIGRNSLLNFQKNNRNTVIGAHADVNADNLNNATAIGSYAKVGCSDCIVLGSTNGSQPLGVLTNNVRVGIGTPIPNNSAALDISSTEKGLLIPRMSLAQRNAIASPANGLMVYQTDNIPGFYFYNGSNWSALGGIAGWGLTGNAGTNSTTNFIGTTDSHPLIFKVNNQPIGKLDLTNIAFGTNSLISNTTGARNMAIGLNALESNTTGFNNTANGTSTLMFNTTGYHNTAVGSYALRSNTEGYYNTATGVNALEKNTTGLTNVACGYNSLRFNTIGNSNTANGVASLYSNTTGNSNTASGNAALSSNTTGSHNTAGGQDALVRNTIGMGNTAIGVSSLHENTTGELNTGIGFMATVGSENLRNATAIGYSAIVDASNKIRLGNSAVTSVESAGTFNTVSDGRFKFNVKEDVQGLQFIMKLRPVTYQFDENRMDVRNDSFNEESLIRRTGFIAQEVEQAAEVSNYNFNGVIKPQTEKEHYSLSYSSFVVPLVKAVQEQQKQIEELKKENEELKKVKDEINALKKMVEKLSDNR